MKKQEVKKGHCKYCNEGPFETPQKRGAHVRLKHPDKVIPSSRKKKSPVQMEVNFCPTCGVRIANAVVVGGDGRRKVKAVPMQVNFCSRCGKPIPNAIYTERRT